MSVINRAIPAFLCLVLPWYISSYPFIFNLYVSLYLMYFLYQHTVGSCFFSQSNNLWFLFEVFSLLIFNIIICLGLSLLFWCFIFISTIWIFVPVSPLLLSLQAWIKYLVVFHHISCVCVCVHIHVMCVFVEYFSDYNMYLYFTSLTLKHYSTLLII